MPSPKAQTLLAWLLQIAAAAILLQTLFFKFSGAEESVYIFSTLGLEPWGRFATGTAELIAAGLLLSGKLAWWGAALALAIMLGALGGHLFGGLGIVVQGDGGLLFSLACAVAAMSALLLWLRRAQAPVQFPAPARA
ncbi:MAG: DoxX family protein [Verrucomicrobiota bacterium JB022]|nr:DoxX family protein [Verrucomicrobiota bacterium JB022]